MKTISTKKFASIKRIAMNVNPLVTKKSKILAKIEELKNEVEQINEEISGNEMGVIALTGGLTSEELIVKQVEDTGKFDTNGKPIKKTSYLPNEKYIVYNEELKAYEIKESEDNESEVNEAVETTDNVLDDDMTEDDTEVSEYEEVTE